MRDMKQKRRSTCGERQPNSKVTKTDVEVMRKRVACGETCEAVARDFPVAANTVSLITRGLLWKHVGGPTAGADKSARGERNNNAKLTAAQVACIRERLKAGESQASVGRIYGVHKSTIGSIAQGKRWASTATNPITEDERPCH